LAKAGALYESYRLVKLERPARPFAGIPVMDEKLIYVA
jgi:hypothetical protein